MAELYSHSRIRCFENCPKQFHFRYVLQLPEESESIEAFVGKRVHEVLERLYEFVGREMMPSLSQVVSRYHQSFDVSYDPERVRIVKEENPLSFYRDLGERCLQLYYRRHYPFDQDETLGIEERVEFDLDPDGAPGEYRMQGIVDRISRTPDGTTRIIDYKTGSYVPRQEALDKDRQLALYQLGLADRIDPDAPVELVWYYLSRGAVRRSTRTPEQLQELRRETAELIDRIRSEEEWKPKKSALCGWCEFRSACPAFEPHALHRKPARGRPEPPPRDEPAHPPVPALPPEPARSPEPAARRAPEPSAPQAPAAEAPRQLSLL